MDEILERWHYFDTGTVDNILGTIRTRNFLTRPVSYIYTAMLYWLLLDYTSWSTFCNVVNVVIGIE